MLPSVQESKWHQVNQAQVNEFAELSGGKGRLHVDPEFAAGTAFGGTVVHGLMLVGIVGSELRRHAGLRSCEPLDLQVVFRKPLLTGQIFKVRSRAADRGREVELVNAEGEVLLEGHADCRAWSQDVGPER